jgi:pimeloyl-ACP methyl ester carboxylesterase
MKLSHAAVHDDLSIAYYKHGDGAALVVLLHGFPDDAATMLGLMERLDATRYTLVAPFLPGYAPSGGARPMTMLTELADDIAGLIVALGHSQAILIGHDWGAIAAWVTAQRHPERVRAVAGLSVPPLKAFLRVLARHPSQWARSSYILLFQLPFLPELLLGADDGALIARAWKIASPTWTPDPARLAKVRVTLRGRSLRAALGYYRGLIRGAVERPADWQAGLRLIQQPITQPALVLYGDSDGVLGPELFSEPALSGLFSGPYTVRAIPGCGHFPQHEAPDATLAALTAWLDGL